MTFTVNSLDMSPFLSKLKPEYNVLVSDKSGRNARGNTTIDIVNKKTKLNCTFISMTQTDMQAFLTAIEDYVYSLTYTDSKTNANKTITVYNGVASPEYYWYTENEVRYLAIEMSFIEL